MLAACDELAAIVGDNGGAGERGARSADTPPRAPSAKTPPRVVVVDENGAQRSAARLPAASVL